MEALGLHRSHFQEIVFGTPQPQAAGFMVADQDNQGFFRILLIKFQCDLDGIIQSKGVIDRTGDIVGVAGVVDTTRFDHEEERLVMTLTPRSPSQPSRTMPEPDCL